MAPSPEAGGEGSTAAAQNGKGNEAENQSRHHHDGESIGGLYKIQQGLDLRARISCGPLLKLGQLFLSYFSALMKDRNGKQAQSGGDAEKQKATNHKETDTYIFVRHLLITPRSGSVSVWQTLTLPGVAAGVWSIISDSG